MGHFTSRIVRSRWLTLMVALMLGFTLGAVGVTSVAATTSSDSASGFAVIEAGKNRVTVSPGIDITGDTRAFADLASNPLVPVAVARVVRSGGSDEITIVLTGRVLKDTKVSWAVTNLVSFAGEPGPEGPPGPIPTVYRRNAASAASDAGTWISQDAFCDPGDQATGGGHSITGEMRVKGSHPQQDPGLSLEGWHVDGWAGFPGLEGGGGVTVWVMCLDADLAPVEDPWHIDLKFVLAPDNFTYGVRWGPNSGFGVVEFGDGCAGSGWTPPDAGFPFDDIVTTTASDGSLVRFDFGTPIAPNNAQLHLDDGTCVDPDSQGGGGGTGFFQFDNSLP